MLISPGQSRAAPVRRPAPAVLPDPVLPPYKIFHRLGECQSSSSWHSIFLRVKAVVCVLENMLDAGRRPYAEPPGLDFLEGGEGGLPVLLYKPPLLLTAPLQRGRHLSTQAVNSENIADTPLVILTLNHQEPAPEQGQDRDHIEAGDHGLLVLVAFGHGEAALGQHELEEGQDAFPDDCGFCVGVGELGQEDAAVRDCGKALGVGHLAGQMVGPHERSNSPSRPPSQHHFFSLKQSKILPHPLKSLHHIIHAPKVDHPPLNIDRVIKGALVLSAIAVDHEYFGPSEKGVVLLLGEDAGEGLGWRVDGGCAEGGLAALEAGFERGLERACCAGAAAVHEDYCVWALTPLHVKAVGGAVQASGPAFFA